MYELDTVVQLAALPADGYQFDSWSGDATTAASTAALTMTRDMNVLASFELAWFEVYLPLVVKDL